MSWSTPRDNHPIATVRLVELVLFALFGTMMFCSKLLMEALPNIHLLGMFTMTFTLVFRQKALIPIYVYVALCGLYAGFSAWWTVHLYVWAVLWGITMLLPRSMPHWVAAVVYPLVCALHGLCYGVLCAPVEALIYSLDFQQTLVWIARGLPFDAIHGVGNLCAGLLILPLTALLQKLMRTVGRH